MGKHIRILIADDHPIFRKGLVDVVRAEPQSALVGEASDGALAWEMVQRLKPQIALLDIDMPGLDGLTVAGRIRDAKLPVAVVILTIHKEENIFNAAMDLGVRGYVLKENAILDLTNALRTVARGEVFLSPSISSFLLNRVRRQEQLRSAEPGITSLTPMELRVLKLVADNQTNDAIARQLFISPRTVHTHRNNICTKLNLHGNRGLLMFALEHKDELQRIRLLPLNPK
ncbi:MAG: response regulator transcription factor [Verrucomicrobia bacterium]|nr:response regulator transcription factor [Verrucomicrobiota bacterium]